jgi:type VI secretion system protein ImpJ
MHLAQHHFQVQNRYVEESIAFTIGHLFSAPYGLASCELDPNALLNGLVVLQTARGILPDGTPFHFPDSDVAPAPLAVAELFSPTQDAHEVHLVLPQREQRGSGAADAPGGRARRYTAELRSIEDELTGGDARPVEVGCRNFSLSLDRDVADGSSALPIARIRRDGSGHFIYDPDFIPPSLQIGASRRLVELLHSLIETLNAKAAALAEGRRAPGAARGEWAAHELAGFWLANAIHTSIPPLQHHLVHRASSPEALHVELSRLAGALCTFALDAHPRDLPSYDHARPERGFAMLESQIRAQLGVILPTRSLRIPLRPYPNYRDVWVGEVSDPRVLDGAEWILGVKSSLPMAQLIADVPRLVKVCGSQPGDVSADTSFIVRLVKQAHPGLVLEHLPAPPAVISPSLGTQYFRVTRAGPCWQLVSTARGVGLYAPDALTNPEFELVAVLPTT